MDKKERRPGYFARLKKRRQLKSQSETLVKEADQSEAGSRSEVIGEAQEKGLKEETQKENTHSDVISKPSNETKKKKQRPAGTVEYTVCVNDTLNSVALKFNITPNKLVQLNRLYSRCLVPGQKLFVPDTGQLDSSHQNGTSDQDSAPQPSKHTQEDVNGSGLLLSRQLSPPSEDESPATLKFIKMSCRYFTDGMGVVGGVMIVTPNTIMFDPHKSDPLVIELGCEEYGLICPMVHLVSVALYDDLSRMHLKDALPSDELPPLCPLYRPGEWEELPSERDINPFSRYQDLHHQQQPPHGVHGDQPQHSLRGDHSQQHPYDNQTLPSSSPSDEGFTELHPLEGDRDQRREEEEEEEEKREKEDDDGEEEKDEGLHTRSSDETSDASRPPSSLMPPSHSHTQSPSAISHTPSTHTDPATEELTRQDAHTQPLGQSKDTHTQPHTDPSPVPAPPPAAAQAQAQGDCGRCSVSGEGAGLTEEEKRRRSNEANEVKLWLLQRMQGPIENLLLPCEKSKAPPMFLCFKVGRPMRKSFASGPAQSPAHPPHARGKLWEYWFAVPQERVDDLYSFFVQWSPETYGKEARGERHHKETRGGEEEEEEEDEEEQGFIVVEKEELNMIDNFFSEVPRNWEIITINEARRRQSFGSFEEAEPQDLMPCMTHSSSLLEHTHIRMLSGRLPARVQGYPWRLAYSSVEHGTSLKTLYRSMVDIDCPVLLAIKDTHQQVFGAFSTHPFRVSEHCYGTGETFLFNFNPEIKVYRWTGENSYFVKGSLDSLQLGGGGGRLGLWLDADLYHGTSEPCSTFNNQPLATHTDFTIHSLEV
ncbi:nuclear receptor coactivator 7 [Engraulis encrasicolus]|uniref:nuclear receptor coactivator 7 n=1 Tax=Engraulis encrasicolus TaxID=184585 RepID=UPI002FD23952